MSTVLMTLLHMKSVLQEAIGMAEEGNKADLMNILYFTLQISGTDLYVSNCMYKYL